MAEFDRMYGSAGATSAALGTGIAGLSLGVLNSGILNGGIGGLFGGNTANMAQTAMQLGDHYATKQDLAYAQELAKKDSEIALLKSEQNTEVKIADVYERVMTRVNADQRAQTEWNAQQSVNNATMSAAIATNANSIAALQNCCNSITKIVIPNSSVCPGWGDVTVKPAAG